MNPTHKTDEIEAEPASYGYCSWHGGDTDTARLINAIEQGTGPGIGLFACAPCRDQYKLVPLADQS